ncbi:MAG: DNA polymerase I [Acidimicrobiales bacterium]
MSGQTTIAGAASEPTGENAPGILYLLDGNSLLFRAFFALPDSLSTASGQVTNAVYGFTAMLVSLLRDQHPIGMGVAFDRPEPTFRDGMVDYYKANRAETPDLLLPQFEMVREILGSLGIASVDLAGYEADDILATWATKARDSSMNAVVVTGDRDAFQLVEDPYVRVLYTRKGLSDTVLYDEAGIEQRTGAPARLYPFLAALRGDPSDNLPGVPGVGDKTAARLAREFGDIDSLYAHLGELAPKLRENLIAHEAQVRMNAELIPLARDAPVGVGLEQLGLRIGKKGIDPGPARRAFESFELRTLWRRVEPLLEPAAGGAGSPAGSPGGSTARRPEGDASGKPTGSAPVPHGLGRDVDPVVPADAAEAERELRKLVLSGSPVAVEPVWSAVAGRSPLKGLALAAGLGGTASQARAVVSSESHEAGESDEEHEQALWIDRAVLRDGAVMSALAAMGGRDSGGVLAHRAKELMRVLLPEGVDLVSLRMDTAVAAYLLDPGRGSETIESLAAQMAGLTPGAGNGGGDAGQLDLGEPGCGHVELACERAMIIRALAAPLSERLAEAGLSRLHDEVELPLVRVLARMEVAGIAVDAAELEALSRRMTEEAARLEGEIQELVGERFNVNSTPQLRSVLYDRLGLSPGRRTKTGYSTDAATLEGLRGQHPVVDLLLRYREIEKLRSTYGESLLAEVGPDGRIHATFNQTVARTGRLSSDRPNLHNIPVRSEEGRRLRRVFVPAEGCRLLVADYDQVELRVMAHLSKDPGLVAAFAEGRDIHRATAARVFGVTPEEVTHAQRNRAKMVAYGLSYGMEAYGLARRLAIPTTEAQEILDAYFRAFPGVKDLMEKSVSDARQRGYTETLFGRRRPLPDLLSPNRRLREAAERQAMNAGIQGLAADLFKVALVRLDAELDQAGTRSRLVLQVHDEVLVEVPEDEQGALGTLVPSVMSGVAEVVGLSVPLAVSSAWGSSWAEAKGG